ncbi:BZ3500_MvSof-1268-A1-R1_Chr1-3g02232 [Microbotryum saponariae]|uniref:BZ3500_MvSof-1268-A1-R1_Chr1-3g02232 protein n=1 Tax=Microbotryum saponariae TaxID=289078 RepID=A0A2X0KCY1_9BASI|nr:BZ3500_MvSof-1268-A1-R1_Chr1-3g02232 [Microbotryum saponariae]SCZ95723.1 BZ3501_MvSof-1269-A2-R1_Chr1-3g01835 [Microbotryum saponariae]
MDGYSFDTQAIHAGIDIENRPFNTSRVNNPTVDPLEKRLTALKGGIAAIATSSGSSAILTHALSLCKRGDEVVLPYKLYGGTNHAFRIGTHDWASKGCSSTQQTQRTSNPNSKTAIRESGACLSPFAAWQILQGIETLGVRMERHTRNALALAQWLQQQDTVESVPHPGFSHHPTYEVAQLLMPKGSGGMVLFAMNLPTIAAMWDVRTLVINPAFSIQSQLSKDTLIQNGSPDNVVRVSVGLKDIQYIIHGRWHGIKFVAPLKLSESLSLLRWQTLHKP